VDWGGNVVYNFTYAMSTHGREEHVRPVHPQQRWLCETHYLENTGRTVVNCKFPAAVAARMQIGHFMTEIIYRALAKAVPNQVIAASGARRRTMNVFYGRRKDGKPWHSVIIRGEAWCQRFNDGHYVSIFPPMARTRLWKYSKAILLSLWKSENSSPTRGRGQDERGLGPPGGFQDSDDEYAPMAPVNLESSREGTGTSGRPVSAASTEPKPCFWSAASRKSFRTTRMKPGDVIIMDAAGGGGFGTPWTAIRRWCRKM